MFDPYFDAAVGTQWPRCPKTVGRCVARHAAPLALHTAAVSHSFATQDLSAVGEVALVTAASFRFATSTGRDGAGQGAALRSCKGPG